MNQPVSRQIRAFISSTFRDMQAERDYLVKFIFPQLRWLCEGCSVVWGEVITCPQEDCVARLKLNTFTIKMD